MNKRHPSWSWIALILGALFASATLATVPGMASPTAPVLTEAAIADSPAQAKKPKISRHPQATTVRAGKKARFKVAVKGKSLSYQWQVRKATGKWKNVKGKAGKKKQLVVRATRKVDGNRYRLVVRSGKLRATSRAAKLTVLSKPQLSSQPAASRVTSGTKAVFSATATGGALKYQWQVSSDDQKTWSPVPGGRKATLSINTRTRDSGNYYRVRVTNRLGSVTSRTALLYVDSTRQDPARIGDAIMLNDWGAGFVVQIGDVLETGDGVVMAQVSVCYFGEGSANAWFDLDVEYLGNDNVVYDNAGIYLDGDIYDVPRLYTNGCADFTAFAILPTSAIAGGTWVITDRTSFIDRRVAYVAGPW
ncbi:hypothetical protein SAMN06309944_0375 [Micrococcales bacterium KH10]|nr:hypothetical protein SAMN06309944_0375 [Micrococcales bacterium KH10]